MQWVLDLLSLTQTAEHAHLMHANACTHVHNYNAYTLICQLCCSNLQTAVSSLAMATSQSIPSSNADSEWGFSILRKIHTDQRPTLKLSTLISLMSVKFNSEECCHDSIFSEQLLTNCKKATVVHNKK